MDPKEVRYMIISTLLQAGEPVTLSDLLNKSGITAKEASPILKELVSKNLLVEGELIPGIFIVTGCTCITTKCVVLNTGISSRHIQETIRDTCIGIPGTTCPVPPVMAVAEIHKEIIRDDPLVICTVNTGVKFLFPLLGFDDIFIPLTFDALLIQEVHKSE